MQGKTPIAEEPRLVKLITPVQRFLKTETSGGIILLACTVIALIAANSGLSDYYHSLWEATITPGFGKFSLSRPLLFWINDGLMTVFFFVIGLEIKRELLVGELSSFKKSSLPIISAAGGMIFPALIYAALNTSSGTLRGWGIPVATDIAFSISIMSLLGKRVPFSLKIFLAAFAIADDLGAVVVIAIFYTSSISFASLGIGVIFLAALITCNLLNIHRPGIYLLLGFGLWCAFIPSGVHPTIAGVIAALTVPVVTAVNDISEKAKTPLKSLLDRLHPYAAFLIMPVFALANAGVEIHGEIGSILLSNVSLGIILGLFLGKTIGISLFSFLACKLKISVLPSGVSWRQMAGTACIGGIGFTMSLFIASLAFEGTRYLDFARVGILTGSIVSGITGFLILRKNS